MECVWVRACVIYSWSVEISYDTIISTCEGLSQQNDGIMLKPRTMLFSDLEPSSQTLVSLLLLETFSLLQAIIRICTFRQLDPELIDCSEFSRNFLIKN